MKNIEKPLICLMFCSHCLGGRLLPELDFVFLLRFAADLRTFFLTSRPDHQKTLCFYMFGRLGPVGKSASKKNTHFVAEGRYFFLKSRFELSAVFRKRARQSIPANRACAPSPRGAGAQTPAHPESRVLKKIDQNRCFIDFSPNRSKNRS